MSCSIAFHGYARIATSAKTYPFITMSYSSLRPSSSSISVRVRGTFRITKSSLPNSVFSLNQAMGYRALSMPLYLASSDGAFTCRAGSRASGAAQLEKILREKEADASRRLQRHRQSFNYLRIAYEATSEDESDGEDGLERHSPRRGDSTEDNIDEWEGKLASLLQTKNEQEIVSKDRKDRRDFDKLSALATEIDLHCRQYSRTVVFSKVPLPNYRPDVDTKRPQREVAATTI